jgi:hypothetical protein
MLGLIILWHGLTPPAAQNVNASGPEPIGLPVGFALWAFFAAPLLLAIRDRVNLHRRVLAGTLISAVVCAAPALCWASGYSYPDRMGGWLWKLVKAGGEVGERSPVLVALAFVGGSTIFLVLHAIHTSDQRMAWLLGTAIYTSIIVSTAASFALPKYREIPLLTCFPFLVLAVAALASHRLELRSLSAALCAPAALQLLASTAIVGVPYVQFLIDPSSAPTPEWVGH